MNSISDDNEPVEQANEEIRTPKQDPIELEDDEDDDEEAYTGPSELDVLKIRAKSLGITHSPNIGVDTLRTKIDEHIAKLEEDRLAKEAKMDRSRLVTEIEEAPVKEVKASSFNAAPSVAPSARNKLPPMSVMLEMTTDDLMRQPERKRTQIIRARQQFEQLALVRCQVFNNNPAKNDLHGEIFSVQNKYLGVVRKFIPYGKFTENGYHIPRILVNMLREKKYLQVKAVKNQDGTERVEQRLAPEFTITELRPLTQEELKQLASMQAARSSTDAGFVGTN